MLCYLLVYSLIKYYLSLFEMDDINNKALILLGEPLFITE